MLLNSFVESTMRLRSQRHRDRANASCASRSTEYGRRLRGRRKRGSRSSRKRTWAWCPATQGDYFQRLNTQIQAAEATAGAAARSPPAAAPSCSASCAAKRRIVPLGDDPRTTTSRARAGATDTAGRIQETQARLDDLLLRFTDKHPDVIATRETLEQLARTPEGRTRRAAGAAMPARPPLPARTAIPCTRASSCSSTRSTSRSRRCARSSPIVAAACAELRRLVDTVPGSGSRIRAPHARLRRDARRSTTRCSSASEQRAPVRRRRADRHGEIQHRRSADRRRSARFSRIARCC